MTVFVNADNIHGEGYQMASIIMSSVRFKGTVIMVLFFCNIQKPVSTSSRRKSKKQKGKTNTTHLHQLQ